MEKITHRVQRIRLALYTEQPFVARGVAAVLRGLPDLKLIGCPCTLAAAIACLEALRADVLLVHLIRGIGLADLRALRLAAPRCQLILWGPDLGGEFAFQTLQSGVRGILPDDLPVEGVLSAVRSVHNGGLCFERDLIENVLAEQPVTLTPRESQLVSLVAQGLKNKEIASSLGITEGTVKVYLYKLFKKLGMNDRLDMALYGLKNLFSGQPWMAPRTAGSLLLAPRKPPGAPVVH